MPFQVTQHAAEQEKQYFLNSNQSEILSISTSLVKRIPLQTDKAIILGIFNKVIDILADGQLISLVLPELLNGPFHIIISDLPDLQQKNSHTCIFDSTKLILDDWQFIFTKKTQFWHPRPPWDHIQLTRMGLLHMVSMLIRVVNHDSTGNRTTLDHIYHLLSDIDFRNLESPYLLDAKPAFTKKIQSIIGRGPGLTPTGDDFLAGFMLSLWLLHHPSTAILCELIADTAQHHTTHISIAYLNALASGEVDEKWHRFLDALLTYDCQLLEREIRRILGFGASSGADMLAGFTWAINHQLSRKLSPVTRTGGQLDHANTY